MKITLIILQSIDGFIARSQDDDLSWGSKEDKDFFRALTKKIGTMIMGSNTYNNMPPQAFSDRFSLVFTEKPKEYKAKPKAQNIEFFKGAPVDAVNYLEQKGIKQAALIGGGNINNQFLQAGLVDDIFTTIAPVIFGSGVKGFGEKNLDIKLKLLDTQELATGEILLHYQVKSKLVPD